MPLSTNLFGHGSERISIDLRAGSTAYLSADPQLGIMTPGRITFIQVTENQGRADVANLHQTNGVCGKRVGSPSSGQCAATSAGN